MRAAQSLSIAPSLVSIASSLTAAPFFVVLVFLFVGGLGRGREEQSAASHHRRCQQHRERRQQKYEHWTATTYIGQNNQITRTRDLLERLAVLEQVEVEQVLQLERVLGQRQRLACCVFVCDDDYEQWWRHTHTHQTHPNTPKTNTQNQNKPKQLSNLSRP